MHISTVHKNFEKGDIMKRRTNNNRVLKNTVNSNEISNSQSLKKDESAPDGI